MTVDDFVVTNTQTVLHSFTSHCNTMSHLTILLSLFDDDLNIMKDEFSFSIPDCMKAIASAEHIMIRGRILHFLRQVVMMNTKTHGKPNIRITYNSEVNCLLYPVEPFFILHNDQKGVNLSKHKSRFILDKEMIICDIVDHFGKRKIISTENGEINFTSFELHIEILPQFWDYQIINYILRQLLNNENLSFLYNYTFDEMFELVIKWEQDNIPEWVSLDSLMNKISRKLSYFDDFPYEMLLFLQFAKAFTKYPDNYHNLSPFEISTYKKLISLNTLIKPYIIIKILERNLTMLIYDAMPQMKKWYDNGMKNIDIHNIQLNNKREMALKDEIWTIIAKHSQTLSDMSQKDQKYARNAFNAGTYCSQGRKGWIYQTFEKTLKQLFKYNHDNEAYMVEKLGIKILHGQLIKAKMIFLYYLQILLITAVDPNTEVRQNLPVARMAMKLHANR